MPPPKYYLRVRQLNAAQTAAAFVYAIEHLKTPLVPLISVTTGLPHPEFPRSILQYHLLTHPQLDDLARFYHQISPPVRETFRYPARVPAWVSSDKNRDDREGKGRDVDLETKRRRWGRFVGLRGCQSPVELAETQKEIEERMGRQWQRALEKGKDEERLRDKGWRDRW